jgi:hypothetical protein
VLAELTRNRVPVSRIHPEVVKYLNRSVGDRPS